MYKRITVLYASKHSIYLWLSSQSCRCHKSTRVWLLRLVNSLFDMTSVSKLRQTAIWAHKSFIYYWALKNCFVAAVICFSTKNSSRFQNSLSNKKRLLGQMTDSSQNPRYNPFPKVLYELSNQSFAFLQFFDHQFCRCCHLWVLKCCYWYTGDLTRCQTIKNRHNICDKRNTSLSQGKHKIIDFLANFRQPRALLFRKWFWSPQ